MKVSYQRELYRSRMCCELEGEESGCGYPLQMCLRNAIPGLLPCSAEPVDGKTYICWDITSRNDLKELSEGGFTLELLERVLRALYAVMRELDGYLISSSYLVLLPEQIYLDASRKKVEFVCDYENAASFQTGIQRLAEYILAGIDHGDREQMRLGYGLYRLAVQENFSCEEFQRLLFGGEKQPECRTGGREGRGQRRGSDEEHGSGFVSGNDGVSETLQKDAVAGELERQRILDSFFADDEEEKETPRGYLPLFVVLITAVFFGLELFFYLRNGRHIHPGWLVFGLLLMLICTGAAAMGQYMKNAGKRMPGNRQTVKNSKRNRPGEAAYSGPEASEHGIPADQDMSLSRGRETDQYGGETMVLRNPQSFGEEEPRAVLEPAGQGGGRLLIPANGAVLGKLPEAADIILPSPAVSRIHARITRQEEKYFVQDLNSRNGTRVNGRPLASRQLVRLEEQDEISFADLSYCFHMENGKG